MDSSKNTPPAGRPLSSDQWSGGPSGDRFDSSAKSRVGGRTVQKQAEPVSSSRVSNQTPAGRGLSDRSVSQPDESYTPPQTIVLLNDPSCDIDPTVEENYVTVDDHVVKVRDERDQLLAYRSDLMAEQRTLLAREYMKEQGVIFLKALDDPEFAKAQDISVVLDIGGRAVQLVPPLEGQGVSEAKMKAYRSYVLTSTANALNDLPPLKVLRAEMKENDRIFKKTAKKLSKLGVTIDLKLQSKMLVEHTGVVVDLANNSGTISGVPSSEVYLPDDMLKRAPTSALHPDCLYVCVFDDDEIVDSGGSLDSELVEPDFAWEFEQDRLREDEESLVPSMDDFLPEADYQILRNHKDYGSFEDKGDEWPLPPPPSSEDDQGKK